MPIPIPIPTPIAFHELECWFTLLLWSCTNAISRQRCRQHPLIRTFGHFRQTTKYWV